MSTIDWIFTGLIVLLAARCFVRGFVQEILSVASYAGGLFAGLLFSNVVIDFAAKNLGTGSLPASVQYIIAFAICFILGFLIMRLIEKLLREGLEAANLEIFDRILGLALGIGEGLAIVALALIVIEIQPFFNTESLLSNSLFARTILPLIGPTINDTIKPALKGAGGPIELQDILKGKK